MENVPKTVVLAGHTGHLGSSITAELCKSNFRVLGLTRRSVELVVGDSREKVTEGVDLSTVESHAKLKSILHTCVQGPFSVLNCVGYFPGYKGVEEIAPEES